MNTNNYKILIADDATVSHKIITEILETISDNNLKLYFAENGVEACEKALNLLPDLILMDVIMPGKNGIEAIKYLRDQPETADIPIIVLTATESLQSAYNVGANDFISKPFNKYELLIKVRSAMHLLHKIKETKLQKAEIEKKHVEVVEQRDKIASQRKDILDDIRYSKRIQEAIFPTQEYLQQILPEYFILNLPRNIVSGDFYWAGETQTHKVVAVADCTGHGISGAFMTMAGTAFLNEILSRYPTTIQANEILFELRKLVMKLLKQKGEEGEAADGMDISLILIDNEKQTIQFAGANNPLYLIRNDELTVYKGDRMPIGIHIFYDKPFTNNDFDFKKGDSIYMFSDGFADQFGGPRNKKFRYSNFQELLLKIHNSPLKEQKEALERTIVSWKGNNDQVDDILIMGIRF